MINNTFRKSVLMMAPLHIKQWCLKVNPELGHFSEPDIVNVHALLPREYISDRLDLAAQKTTTNTLLAVVKQARLEGLCQPRESTLEQFLNFIKKVIWVHGNNIPGPCKYQRIDSLSAEPQKEVQAALQVAGDYARCLAIALERLSVSAAVEHWYALIELVKSSSKKNIDAQQDIIKWGDAWGTHSEYKIYLRLSKYEVIQARKNACSYSQGAWVLPHHPRLQQMAQVLAQWQRKVNSAQGSLLIDTVNAMRTSLSSPFCERWLATHELESVEPYFKALERRVDA